MKYLIISPLNKAHENQDLLWQQVHSDHEKYTFY